MNQVRLEGNVVRDIEVRVSENGKQYTIFSLAAGTPVFDKEKQAWKTRHPVFADCIAWGETAETLAEFRKGERIAVEGHLIKRKYKPKNFDKEIYQTQVVVTKVYKKLKPPQGAKWDEFASADDIISETL